MLKKIDSIFMGLIIFFSTVFTTMFIGPVSFRLSPVRLVFIVYGLYKILDFLFKKKIRISYGKPICILFLFFWFVYAVIISIIASVDVISSINYIIYLLIGIFIYLVFCDLPINEEFLVFCLRCFLWGVIINNIIAWYELLTHNYYFTLNTDIAYLIRHNYAITFYANPNNLCSFFTFGFIIAMALFMIEKSKFRKLLCLFSMISSVIIMVADCSESNIIGTAVAIAYAFLMFAKAKRKITVNKFMIILVAISLIFIYLTKNIDSLFSYITYVLHSFGEKGSTTNVRIEYATTAISNMLKEHLFGVGAGNSMYYASNHVAAANVHNWFVEIMVDYGILFFGVYIFIYFYQIWILAKKSIIIKKNKKLSIIFLMYATIFVSFLFFNISASSMFSQEYVWIILGIGYYLVSIKIDNKKSQYTLLS